MSDATHDGTDIPPDGYRCPRCRRETGFKYVSRMTSSSRGGTPDSERDLRGSCRFCGYVRESARLKPEGGHGD